MLCMCNCRHVASCRTCTLRSQCPRASKIAGTLSSFSEIYGELPLEVMDRQQSPVPVPALTCLKHLVCHIPRWSIQLSPVKDLLVAHTLCICRTAACRPCLRRSVATWVMYSISCLYYINLSALLILTGKYTFTLQACCTIQECQKCNHLAQAKALPILKHIIWRVQTTINPDFCDYEMCCLIPTRVIVIGSAAHGSYMGPSSCRRVGFGSVQVIPRITMQGMKP